jgi:hypothetical protein
MVYSFSFSLNFSGNPIFHVAIISTLLLSMLSYTGAEKDESCPGSSAWKSAKCKMIVRFQQPCTVVQSEINLRITSPAWIDPHNAGTYKQITSQSGDVHGSRTTASGKYTDLFNFSLIDIEGKGCQLTACSESQVFSIFDYSTNYCNLRNLYCNSEDDCVPVQYNLDYSEEYTLCSQNQKQNCVAHVNSS